VYHFIVVVIVVAVCALTLLTKIVTVHYFTFLLLFILSYKRVLCHVHMLLCLYRLCLSRRACTSVVYGLTENAGHEIAGHENT